MLLHDSAAYAAASGGARFMAAFHWQGRILGSATLSQSCKEIRFLNPAKKMDEISASARTRQTPEPA